MGLGASRREDRELSKEAGSLSGCLALVGRLVEDGDNLKALRAMQLHLSRSRAPSGGPSGSAAAPVVMPRLLLRMQGGSGERVHFSVDGSSAVSSDVIEELKLSVCCALERSIKGIAAREYPSEVVVLCALAASLGICDDVPTPRSGGGSLGSPRESFMVASPEPFDRYLQAAVSLGAVRKEREGAATSSRWSDEVMRHFDTVEGFVKALIAEAAPGSAHGLDAQRIVDDLLKHAQSVTRSVLEGFMKESELRNHATVIDEPWAAEAAEERELAIGEQLLARLLDECCAVILQCRQHGTFAKEVRGLYAAKAPESEHEKRNALNEMRQSATASGTLKPSAPPTSQGVGQQEDSVPTVDLASFLGTAPPVRGTSPEGEPYIFVGERALPPLRDIEPTDLFPAVSLECPRVADASSAALRADSAADSGSPATSVPLASAGSGDLFPVSFLSMAAVDKQQHPPAVSAEPVVESKAARPVIKETGKTCDVAPAPDEVECQLQEITAYYMVIEERYTRRVVRRVIRRALQELPVTSQPTALADDVFYALTMALERAASTTNPNAFTTLLSFATERISGDLTEAISTWLADWNSGTVERRLDSFFAIVNEMESALRDAAQMKERALEQMSKHLGGCPQAKHIVSCLDDIGHSTAAVRAMRQQNIVRLSKNILANVQPHLETFLITDYRLNEEKYRSFEVNDPYMGSLVQTLDSVLAPFLKLLATENGDLLLSVVAQEVVKQLEEVVLQKQFSQLGGLQLSKEIGLWTSFCASKARSPLHGKFSRIRQVSHMLSMDRPSDVLECLNSQTDGASGWKLSPAEVKAILVLRPDFPKQDILFTVSAVQQVLGGGTRTPVMTPPVQTEKH